MYHEPPVKKSFKNYVQRSTVSENIVADFASQDLKFGARPHMVLLPNPILAVALTVDDPLMSPYNDPFLAWRVTPLSNQM